MDAMMWDLTVKAGDLFHFPGAEHGPGSTLVPFIWHLKSSICPVLQRQHRDNLGLLFSLWHRVSRIWMGYSRLCLVCVIWIPFEFNVVCSTPESHMISEFVWLLPIVQTIDICFSFMLAWTTPRACHLYDCNHMGVMHVYGIVYVLLLLKTYTLHFVTVVFFLYLKVIPLCNGKTLVAIMKTEGMSSYHYRTTQRYA